MDPCTYKVCGLMQVIAVMVGFIALAGCGAGRTMIIKAPDSAPRFSSVELVEAKSPASVPVEVSRAFLEQLNNYVYKDGAFQKGPGLKVEYRFIQLNEGNQFKRWFSGGIGNFGEGSMTVEAKFYDQAGKELATIHTDGKISSGFFGGGFDNAVEKSAEQIADYTRQSFR
jgi:hypothetical protein